MFILKKILLVYRLLAILTIGALIIVTLPGVIKQLTSLKPNKASGPDQIPPWFLKDYAHEIGPILTLIYQASIDSGIVLTRWK